MIGGAFGSMGNKPISKKPKRILAIHRYYWPDTPPYASMLKSIASRWASDGHDVEVFSTQPNYKQHTRIPIQPKIDVIDGVRINRMCLPKESDKKKWRRFINLIRFAFGVLFFIVRRPRFDVIMASTAPPVFVGAAARWGAKLTRTKFVYHCMDLHPEIGRLSGEFRNSLLYRMLLRIDANNCKKASAVVVLSNDMKKAVTSRPRCARSNVVIQNNFSLPSHEPHGGVFVNPKWLKEKGVFRLLFAGNIGKFQGLDAFIEAMHLLREPRKIELVLVGEGKALEHLKTLSGDLLHKSIKFIPHQTVCIAKALIRNSDLCLVSLMPEVIKYAYPSKTMVYINEGTPILASVEGGSELGSFIDENNIGISVPHGEPSIIAERIQKLAFSLEYDSMLSAVNEKSLQNIFSEERALCWWSDFIKDVLHAS